ncbi:MAG: 16S rRNA (guanine(966)-N(2))-methyltransferase RsmD [Acidimicrobiia bacterium]|nr:16S rRNA (guanine(966)-N(2))-methyltransferase RsmD [Acidimicrobiia bacterium]
MRVVAGEARGRPIVAPDGNRTRPTSDRVRESIFNMLFSLHATGEVSVLDLYAGCGALGIEALSRGAASCIFVEQDRRAVECIRSNLDALGYAERATVVQADVLSWVAQNTDSFDVVLADPPYADDSWTALLDDVDARWLVAEAATSVEEHPRWDVVREKTYGTTVVTVFARQGSAS